MYAIENSVLQELKSDLFSQRNVRVFIKRDDLIDEFVSGNKWRKLKYNIAEAVHQKKDGILTFGGAFSNHLLATAAACQNAGLKSIGVVRGEELSAESNDNLKRCAALGMELRFVSRTEYSQVCGKDCSEEWKQENSRFLLIPEGGANFHGIIGCQEIWKELPTDINHLFVAQGTATTSAGLLIGKPTLTNLHVVPAIKGFQAVETIKELLYPFFLDESDMQDLFEKLHIHGDHHFGGYAKTTPELMYFISEFTKEFNISLDRIYTGKAMLALFDWLSTKTDWNGEKVVFLHTGGLMNG